ncbi:MAG: DNA polymerase III subunit alpha [Chloroflexi bacterium]|nr:DNA polymerase III subunit alpha [Chloroflexota bacterium]
MELRFGEFYLPHFPVPEGDTPATYLEKLCRTGLQERYPVITPEIEERLQHELNVIERMGFPSYFLVVWDFVEYARKHSVPVGPGRGSAAGSIVAYCLGITSIDPLRHNLIFERFLNPDRISMPDIDMDFADDGRDEVIRYVTEKYGSDHVAQIITFGTMAARAAVRDVGRALGLPYGMVDQVAKLIPQNTEIEKALETVPELMAMYNGQQEIKQVIDVARKLEGGARHASTHAAGVVISRNPLADHVPLAKASRGEIVTQYQMHILEKIGLLKMDFLGLSTLTIMHRTIDLIEQNRGIHLDLDKIPLEDPSIYKILCDGNTVGIFQLEGGMTKRMTIDVKPNCFDDVTALMALIRPGPMAMAPDYIQRKHGQLPIEYMHPDMEPILKETYGVALYQEQVMRIANVLAGYSMSEADALRKAMGKKLPEEMKKQGTRFVSGATERGIKPKLAQEIFDLIERFAGYGFNKAHSAAYAVIACQTSYLKANYPVEYMTAVLTSEQSNSEKVAVAVAECRRMGIEVLQPDVNKSMVDFTVERREKGIAQWVDSVRFGMAAVKNVGLNAIEAIISAREQTPGKAFQSLEHFCELVDWHQVNRRMVESLIKAGAMDCLGDRAELLDRLEQAIGCGQKTQRARDAGQSSLFDVFEQPLPEPAKVSSAQPVSGKVLLAWEKEALGLYVSAHPVAHALDSLSGANIISIADLTPDMTGQQVCVAGMLTSMRSIPTKKGQTMVIATLEDMEGTVELVAFPECYERNKDLLQEDNVVTAEAKVDVRNDSIQLICQSIRVIGAEEPPQAEPSRAPRLLSVQESNNSAARSRGPALMKYLLKIYLTNSEDLNEDIRKMQELDKILRRHPGESYVNLYVPNGSGYTCLQPYGLDVSYCEELEAEIIDLLGTESLRAEQSPDDTPDNAVNGNGGNGGNGHYNGNGRSYSNGRGK